MVNGDCAASRAEREASLIAQICKMKIRPVPRSYKSCKNPVILPCNGGKPKTCNGRFTKN